MTGGGDVQGLDVIGLPWRHLERCTSTNDEAAAWAREGAPHGAVVTADEQTAGRGRLRRAWYSPPGENLYFSAVLRPPIEPAAAPPLALVAAVAAAEAVEIEGARPELKWPNDLLLDGKKLGGILTEMATSGGAIQHVIVGVGLNCHTRSFPEELAGQATSLAIALGRPVDLRGLAASLASHLDQGYQRFLAEGPAPAVAAWKMRARMLGQEIEVTSGRDRLRGVAEDVDDQGALILRLPDGRTERVIAGEVSRPEA